MSWNPPNCPQCQTPTRFESPTRERPNSAAALAWTCHSCELRVLELIPLGVPDAEPGDCLNCGERLGADGRCPDCGVEHERLVARVRELCSLPPQAAAIEPLRERGLYRVALNAVDLRLQHDPRDAEALSLRGKLLLDLLHPAAAVPIFRRALAAGAEPGVTINLGVALADSGRRREAIEVYERFLTEHPEHPRRAIVLSNIGGCHSALGHPALGESYHRRAIACDPSHMATRWNLFANLVNRGCWAEAVAVIDDTLERVPLEPRERANLQAYRAEGLLRLGRHADALAAIDASLIADSGDADRQMTRARILVALGRLDDARLALLRVLERVPGSRPARELLGRILCVMRPRPN